MTRRTTWKPILAALALAALGACATTQRISAAGDVHALLIAIRDDDHAGFDAHIDRDGAAARAGGRILEHTQATGANDTIAALGALLAHPMARLASDALLRPNVFRSIAEYYGYKPGTPIPGQLEIAGALRALPDGRVCAAKGHAGPCLISFANEGGVWKLVSFDGDIKELRLPG